MRGYILFLAFILLVASVGCQTSDLTSGEKKPAITTINPASVSRGQQNVNGRIQGDNFIGIVAVDLDAGIKIHMTKILSVTELEVVYSVNADAPTGKRSIRIATSAGITTSDGLLNIDANRAPTAVFSVDPVKGAKDTLFTFNASGSEDADGTVASYGWDFGDGATANGKVVTHRYNAAGNFKVTLTVQDNHQGASSTERDVLVENAIFPIARFSYDPHVGPISRIFQFDGSGSTDKDGRIVSYDWNFKDGTTARGKLVKHKFKRVDQFDVELTVKDNSGLESSIEKTVEIRGEPPVADFTVSPFGGPPSTTFQFNASQTNSESGIEKFEWNFGDTHTGLGKIVSHKYSSEGNYTVQLTVTDQGGLVDSKTATLPVREGGGGGGGGGGGTSCTQPAKVRVAYLFTVLQEDQASKTIVGKFREDVTCNDVFYLCGDVRLGAYNGAPGKEYWMGTICAMESLGNNTFRIHLVGGTSWVGVGENGTYVWPQNDCDPRIYCKAFGY